jgi:hypothetical protein
MSWICLCWICSINSSLGSRFWEGLRDGAGFCVETGHARIGLVDYSEGQMRITQSKYSSFRRGGGDVDLRKLYHSTTMMMLTFEATARD